MNIYHGTEDFKKLDCAVVTSGTFDGVHVGHQKIIKRLKDIAKASNGETVLITFWPHPRFVLNPDDKNLHLLTTFDEKVRLLEQLGIDHLVKIPFTQEFSQLSSEDFIQKILIKKIGTRKLVIGYDHRFGKNREGSFEHLQANAHVYGFEVEEIPRKDVDNITVSSTKIRKALEEGNVHLANEFLGRDYSITGKVINGNRIGRQLGFPTANIQLLDKYKLVPADSIYAAKTLINNRLYKGMLYIGNRPTIDGLQKVIEINVFDFNKDIYNQEITLFFVEKVREDEKFESLDELKHQLLVDKEQVKKILGEK